MYFSVVGENSLGLRFLTGQEAGHAFLLVVGLEAVAEQLFLDLDLFAVFLGLLGHFNGEVDLLDDVLKISVPLWIVSMILDRKKYCLMVPGAFLVDNWMGPFLAPELEEAELS